MSLNHQEPDHVPIDFSGHRSSGIAAMAYPHLRAALDLPPRPVRVYDPIQQLAIVDEDVLDRLGVDVIEMGRAFALEDSYWADWVLPDGTPCKMPVWALLDRGDGEWVLRSASGRGLGRMPDGADFFDQTYWPFLETENLNRIPEIFNECMWTAIAAPPGPSAPDAVSLAEGARRLRRETDRAILGGFGGNLLELGQWIYRMDNFMMMLGTEPGRVHAFLDKATEVHMANLERFLTTVGDSIDIILFGDDLGGQNAPLMSPRMYREFFKPRHSMMWKRAKQLAGIKVMLHCCGAVRQILPDLIDAGLDAINPVQISCHGMDAEGLKRDFGRDITFWGGGCDTQRILTRGTPEQVREHVRRQVAALASGGGFVFQQVHNILANVPAENIVAMFQTVAGASYAVDA